MCKRILKILLLGWLGYLLLLSVWAAEPVKLVLAYQDVDNFPYEIGEGSAVPAARPGLSLEMLQRVAAQLHLELTFQRLPWKRCFLEMQEGRMDGVFSASFKPERLASGNYPMLNGQVDPARRMFSTAYVAYKLKANPLQWDGQQFTPFPSGIGAIRGYSIVDDISKMGIPILEVKDLNVAFTRLQSHAFEAVATLELAGDAILQQHPAEFSQIVKLTPPLKTAHYYLMLSPQLVQRESALAETIWTTIGTVRDSADFQRLSEQYVQEEVPGAVTK